MRCLLVVTVVACGALAAADANADDSLAGVGTGGLTFERADGISMQREDLFISVDEVRVRYEFRNDRGAPFIGHVAFPLPVINPLSIKYTNSQFTDATPLEWLDFHLMVNGVAIAPKPRIWATVDGRDITQELEDNGIDIRKSGLVPNLDPLTDRPERLRQLEAIGAVKDEEPQWETNVAYEWDQTFQPGVTIVEHVYKPLTGGAYAPIGRDAGPTEAKEAYAADQLSRYCVPRETAHAAIEAARRNPDPDVLLWFSFVSFILKTARNWDGPIGTFHLTLRAPDPDTQVGACLPRMNLARTTPTDWEAEAKDWVADTDIDAVFFGGHLPK